MKTVSDVTAILLAAGFSQRYGTTKLQAKMRGGKTIFQQTIENLHVACPRIVVVTRPGLYHQLENSLAEFVNFPDADTGMGASLAFGMRKLMEKNPPSACLICLADMPFIQPGTYQSVAEELRECNIVIPRYQGKPGNPVGFDQKFFNQLAALSGDQGGREIIAGHREEVCYLDISDPAILDDIDTPEDLVALEKSRP